MSFEIDPAVLAAYRSAAQEEPSARLDALVTARARPRERTPLVLWAQAAVVALMIGAALLAAREPAGPPSPDDPRYFGLYAGREKNELLTLALAPPDPIADNLLQAGRPPQTRKE
jgi:hypothetical protein